MLCDQLRALKEEKHLTVQQIADRSGVPVSTVSRVLSGQTDNPNFQTVCDIVMAMGGSLDELAGIKPPHEAPTDADSTTRLYNRIIENKNRWIHRMFVLACVLAGILVAVLAIDALNPEVWFFKY